MKIFILFLFSILMLNPVSVLANTENFIEKRQSRAIENQSDNMLAAEHFERKNDDEIQEQEEETTVRKSLRFQLEEEKKPIDR